MSKLTPNPYESYGAHYARAGNISITPESLHKTPGVYGKRRPWFPTDHAARILDLGCGWGHQLAALSVAGHKNLWGIDRSGEAVRRAKSGLEARATIIEGDGFEWLSQTSETFDLIILNDVIEHLDDITLPRALTIIGTALRPGGVFVVRTPNMSSLFAAHSRYIDITHQRGFTPLSLTQLLEENGFCNIHYLGDCYEVGQGWSVRKPWKKLGARAVLNHLLHATAFWLRGHPFKLGLSRERVTPDALFGDNIEVWCSVNVTAQH